MRRLVVGDIHGAYRALIQALERASYNPEEDHLIFLGDLVDGWPESSKVIEHVRHLPNTTVVLGNHDHWAMLWLLYGQTPDIWTSQGGWETIRSYDTPDMEEVILAHGEFLSRLPHHHVDPDNNLYVHGGFNWKIPIEEQDVRDLMWDRHLIQTARMWQLLADRGADMSRVHGYNQVFVGHTTTSRMDPSLKPQHFSNVWALDQGAGWEGKLTIMDTSSWEYWQSDITKELYPEAEGR